MHALELHASARLSIAALTADHTRTQEDGTRHGDSPTYVRRRADDLLAGCVQRGELCYVFNTRQMLGLERWCRSLAPITDHLVRAAAGEADVAFWRRIYNPIDAYGGDVITGWITRLYPYLRGAGAMSAPNSMLDLPIDEPRGLTTPKASGRFYSGPGLRSDAVPDTRPRVTVRVGDRVAKTLGAVALVAGLVAVAQDTDGALRPIAGWHLERASAQLADVLDRIARDHRTTRQRTIPRRIPRAPGR